MCATTALVDSAVRRWQSSQPSRQPSSSLPTPEHLAISFGNVIGSNLSFQPTASRRLNSWRWASW